ncbi:hypothetical protein C7S14_4380 [Burkholderia cepacia]|nr:hypothetical protein C7S14_4380 [Burkholderia cepacia]
MDYITLLLSHHPSYLDLLSEALSFASSNYWLNFWQSTRI